MRLEQLKAEEAKLKKELKAVRKRIKKATPEDGWYLDDRNEYWMLYAVNGVYKFGIDAYGSLANLDCVEEVDLAVDRLATKEEYTKRLTEFVNSLGYKEGVKIQSLYFSGVVDLVKNNSIDFQYVKSSGFHYISIDGFTIWRSDKGWAKIIEQKPKYTVKPSKFGFDGNEVFSDFTILKDGGMVLGDECEQISKQIENFLNSES